MPHKTLFPSLIGAAALLSGCGSPFLNTALQSDPAISDAGLTGEWTTDRPTTTRAIISEPVPGMYSVSLTVLDAGAIKTAINLDLTLTDIAGARYADLFLSRAERDKLVTAYGFLAVPVHQVMKIARDGDQLRVWSFDSQWLEGAARGEHFSFDTVTVGGGEVTMVTAPTDQVRDLLARHGDDPHAFGDPIEFRRVGQRTGQ